MSGQVVTCSKIIAIHNLQSRQPVANYTYHRGIINCTSINHTNKVIASCGQDGKIFLVTADKPENKLIEKNFYPNYKEKPSSLTACAFSPNSRYVAAGSVDSIIKLWDLRGDKNAEKDQTIQIKSHMCGVTSLAWVKNLRSELMGTDILASSSSSGEIFLHSNKTGSFQDVMALKMQEGINCIRVSEGMDYCRMFACTNGGTLAVWDLLSGKDKPFWTTTSPSDTKASMTSLSISPYNPVLLVTASVDESLNFFDIHDRKPVKKITAEEPLSCVGLHSNGYTLVAGGMYGNCFVYDLRNPSKPQIKLAGHQTTIKHLQFFKQKQKQPSLPMGQNKSKPPSLSNPNSSSSIPPAVEQKIIVTPATSNVTVPETKSKQNVKIPEMKVNNFMTVAAQKLPIPTEMSRQKKIEQKLSTTAQQLMKNPTNIRSEVVQGFSETGGSENFRQRTRQFKNEAYQSTSVREGELKEVKQKVSELQREVKQIHNDMFQMEQRLNLSLIRQFQLQQSEMKALLFEFLSKDKEKDEYIKKLQAENSRLKNSTF